MGRLAPPALPPSLPSTDPVLGSTARPQSPGPELPAGQAFKSVACCAGNVTGPGARAEQGHFFFIIKKQNLNQENKVIKFLLGAAGP